MTNKTENFNLSEKKQRLSGRFIYFEEDVKEFIRLLKEASENNDWEVAIDDGEGQEGFRVISGIDFIDKLAGDKLI